MLRVVLILGRCDDGKARMHHRFDRQFLRIVIMRHMLLMFCEFTMGLTWRAEWRRD